MKKQTACPSHKYLTTFGRKIRKGLFLSVFMLGLAAQLTAAPGSENKLSNSETRFFQQTITVSGTIRDNTGVPLTGASVTVKGTSQGTTTSSDGAFSLTVPSEQSVLVIEHTGYDLQEIRVGTQ